jgi:hypothetical protein
MAFMKEMYCAETSGDACMAKMRAFRWLSRELVCPERTLCR